MIHSWDNLPSISLSFKLAFVVPRRCINALTLKNYLSFALQILGINRSSDTHWSGYELPGSQIPFETHTLAL